MYVFSKYTVIVFSRILSKNEKREKCKADLIFEAVLDRTAQLVRLQPGGILCYLENEIV